MKNLIILGFLVLTPLSSIAFDALTPTETEQALANNANFLLKADYHKYCEAEPLRIEKEIAAISALSIPDWSKSMKMEPLFRQMQENADKCSETKEKIINQTLPTTEQSKNFGCGPGYIKRGGACITPTATCQMYFGQDVTGVKSLSQLDTAECTCKTGYTLTSGVCVASNTPNVAAVLGTNTVNTEAQLKAVIAQLTAQVAALIQQLNAKLGR